MKIDKNGFTKNSIHSLTKQTFKKKKVYAELYPCLHESQAVALPYPQWTAGEGRRQRGRRANWNLG